MDLSINEGTLVVTGGIGDSVANAIGIKQTPRGMSAAGAEHLVLARRYGRKGLDWTIASQSLLRQNGRVYDVFRIVVRDDDDRTLYFDVTDWLARAGTL